MLTTIYINNIKYNVPSNLTILQACEYLGIIIPHFCYNEYLLIAGNCRMCLVEVFNSPKPVASCAVKVTNDIKIFTETPLLDKVRENILEFLLINHPLDCPICDQGGECDLQDLSFYFGSDRSRFFLAKRSVSDKKFSPVIKSVMTRCIHCTRCVRFISELSVNKSLGVVGRGNSSEINTYYNEIIKSELSGNVIDLCPVGALTSKSMLFKGRSWELNSISTIDNFDMFCNPIFINYKFNKILRILPNKVFEIQTNWISDRVRFSYDSYSLQRLNIPLYKQGNQFIKLNWKEVFNKLYYNLYYGSVTGIVGESSDVSSIYCLKKFLNFFGSSDLFIDSLLNNLKINQDFQSNYLFNSSFNEIENSNFILLLNTDLRFESSSLNLKLKELYIKNSNLKIINIGIPVQSTYPVKNIGWNFNIFIKILEGKSKISKQLLINDNPFILGDLNFLKNLKLPVNKIKFNFLNLNLFEVNSFELGITQDKNIKTLINKTLSFILLNSHNFNLKILKNKFIIFIGYQAGININYSNLILPSLSFLESKNLNICNKGISYQSNEIFKVSLKIKNISNLLNYFLFYVKVNFSINLKNYLPLNFNQLNLYNKKFNKSFIYNISMLENKINNFYLFSNFHKTSLLMQNCSKTIFIHKNSFLDLKKNN